MVRQGGGRVASPGLVALWMVIGIVAIGILSGIPGAARAAVLTLDEVSFTTLPGNEVQVRLGLSGPPGKPPRAFTIDNPARIALDFADTGLNLADRHRAIGVGPAQSVTAVAAGGRTRVVLNLVRQVPYNLRVEGSAVVVTLHSGGAMMPDVPSVATTPVAAGPRPPPSPAAYSREARPPRDRGRRFPPRRGRRRPHHRAPVRVGPRQ